MADGVKFGRTIGGKNKTNQEKIEKIEIFLQAKKAITLLSKSCL